MHTLEVATATDPAAGVMTGIITGVVITLITATLIPFITTQFSLWSQRRAEIVKARRAAHDAYREATVRARMKHLVEKPMGGPVYESMVANDEERQAAVERFSAQFAIPDGLVYKIWVRDPNTSETSMILSSWANGHNVRARRAARSRIRALAKSEKAQVKGSDET